MELYMSLGSAGPEVLESEQMLSRLGYYVDVNGQFDRYTQRAVSKFQMDRSIPATGIINNVTFEHLKYAVAEYNSRIGQPLSFVPKAIAPPSPAPQEPPVMHQPAPEWSSQPEAHQPAPEWSSQPEAHQSAPEWSSQLEAHQPAPEWSSQPESHQSAPDWSSQPEADQPWREINIPSLMQEGSISGTITRANNYNFCIIAGKEYVVKAAALHDSLKRHTSNFNLFICCMDPIAFSMLGKMNLSNVILIRVEVIEDDRLRYAKSDRKMNEYCWTLKAPLIEFCLTHYGIDSVIYCDGDIYFFSDPKPIFDEWGSHSVFMCRQRDVEWVEQLYGRYQAGLIGFRNDQYGLESLRWWKEKCLEWCYHRAEEGKFGDQKYLDYVPNYFPNIKISDNLGINAAPWNCIYNNDFRIHRQNNELYIENDKLVAYHFACIAIYNENEFDLWSIGEITIGKIIKNEIYVPYLDKLRDIIASVKVNDGYALSQALNHEDPSKAKTYYKYSGFRRKMDQWDQFFNFATIVHQENLIRGLALYHSLKNKIGNFHHWICCMDDYSYHALSRMNLENASLIQMKEVENEELLRVKSSRKRNEYSWTLKAPLCLHILSHYKEIDHIIYCDPEVYFFSDPKPILDEWWKYSIFLCKQRGNYEHEQVQGLFQSSLVGFKREENSITILKWWKDKCLEKCSENYDANDQTFRDQRYLEYIPLIFQNIKLIDHKGINAAPWNVILNNHYSVGVQENKVFIYDNELVSYHFGNMLIYNQDEYDLWQLAPISFDYSIISNIYTPYINTVKEVCKSIHFKTGADVSLLYEHASSKHSAKNYFKF
ncbi:peptidoglycan-binding protein [Paenibacillus sp. MER TA 81-3]|uniref:peptidoglycan-binding domain-containing protein n=1 Tax=Paenibacillus sp. MER TA 81-3 TaxID=2939573 RepID=UPI00203E08CE|nr:peptidoglycan-binding protein [Paenibacillus sp. MER TA 81-3]MCM3339794.1 peptidoglycan-binding protein [Paenibacillus sp. MER TA 81-3]